MEKSFDATLLEGGPFSLSMPKSWAEPSSQEDEKDDEEVAEVTAGMQDAQENTGGPAPTLITESSASPANLAIVIEDTNSELNKKSGCCGRPLWRR